MLVIKSDFMGFIKHAFLRVIYAFCTIFFISLGGLFSLAEAAQEDSAWPVEHYPEGEFLGPKDSRNPLSVQRLPISMRLKALSDELVKEQEADHEKVLEFIKYISNFRVGVASSRGPDATIMERVGACGSFTNVLLAFAASQGMDGRIVSLLNYPENNGHAVAEIKIDSGWALYDASYGVFYTLKGDVRPLSFLEIKYAYLNGVDVTVHRYASRPGAERFTGRNIFVHALPSGPIGPDKPFYFPLSIDFSQRNELVSSDFGPKWQGANFIGAAATNQQQNWVIRGLVPGREYFFRVSPARLGGDLVTGNKKFLLRAWVDLQGGGKFLEHEFDFESGDPVFWDIKFKAYSDKQSISLLHDYLGPDYRYMIMDSYKVVNF